MTKKNKVVGSRNYENKPLAKPFIKLIVDFQNELQQQENKKKLGKKRRISFVYASLELSRIIKKQNKK